MPAVKVMVGLTVETDRTLDRLAQQCAVGRSEIVRQLIALGAILLRTPYAEHELDAWHAVRALRAQLGDQEEYKKEYPRA